MGIGCWHVIEDTVRLRETEDTVELFSKADTAGLRATKGTVGLSVTQEIEGPRLAEDTSLSLVSDLEAGTRRHLTGPAINLNLCHYFDYIH